MVTHRSVVAIPLELHLLFLGLPAQHGGIYIVHGALALPLQGLAGMNNADFVYVGDLLLGVPQQEGPDPVQPMACSTIKPTSIVSFLHDNQPHL